ncbi:MAG: hypothetical protein BWK76_11420 [Desulfobulbaceae bacterium A2]|nr:MAG: hypothetical protein BWK76_11420 [Desulfobulbaceae bacterium A2]
MHLLESASRRLCLLFVVLLAGCAGGQDFDYVPGNEIKPGPGLVTGKDGSFTLLGPAGGEPKSAEGQGGKNADPQPAAAP